MFNLQALLSALLTFLERGGGGYFLWIACITNRTGHLLFCSPWKSTHQPNFHYTFDKNTRAATRFLSISLAFYAQRWLHFVMVCVLACVRACVTIQSTIKKITLKICTISITFTNMFCRVFFNFLLLSKCRTFSDVKLLFPINRHNRWPHQIFDSSSKHLFSLSFHFVSLVHLCHMPFAMNFVWTPAWEMLIGK